MKRFIRAAFLAATIALVGLAGSASANDKVTLCHAAGLDGTTQYVTIEVGWPAAYGPAGHFYENGTPRAGHEQDYLGPCTATPSPTPPAPTSTPSPSASPSQQPTPSPSTSPTPSPTSSPAPTPVMTLPPTDTDPPTTNTQRLDRTLDLLFLGMVAFTAAWFILFLLANIANNKER